MIDSPPRPSDRSRTTRSSAIAKRRRSSAVTGLSTGCAGPVSIQARASLPCLADRSTEDGSSRQVTREPGLRDATSMARLSS
jgi:hypothetical protein